LNLNKNTDNNNGNKYFLKKIDFYYAHEKPKNNEHLLFLKEKHNNTQEVSLLVILSDEILNKNNSNINNKKNTLHLLRFDFLNLNFKKIEKVNIDENNRIIINNFLLNKTNIPTYDINDIEFSIKNLTFDNNNSKTEKQQNDIGIFEVFDLKSCRDRGVVAVNDLKNKKILVLDMEANDDDDDNEDDNSNVENNDESEMSTEN
jgi:hypothetical protein